MEQQHPPKNALRFLRWFCREDYLEEIEGNLIELFEKQQAVPGEKAQRQFYWNVLRHFRPEYIRSFHKKTFNSPSMYKHYVKIAWRSILRQKLYALINIAGLAVGLSCFILILLYIQHELSYDRFYPNAGQIYRIYQRQQGNMYQGSDYFAVTPPGLAGALKNECPEVMEATSVVDRTALLGNQEGNFWEKGLFADPYFFRVFPFPFLQGDPRHALEKSESIVLTYSLAQKLFGNKNPIGQTIQYAVEGTRTVTGVMEDPPTNISFKFSFVTSILSDEQYVSDIQSEKWNNNSLHTFLSLAEQADPAQLQSKLAGLIQRHIEQSKTYPSQDTYLLQPLADLHLETGLNFDIGLKGSSRYISLFSIVAMLVLILACINYMNLAIARSINRAREVGLRKVIGAGRRQLIGQFIGESVLIAFLSLLAALVLCYLLAPLFSHLLERPIVLSFTGNLYLVAVLPALVLVVGIVSGSYPALFMSSLRPAQVLQGKANGRSGGIRLQRLLIIGQYATSIVLIISSIVIYRQFHFIQRAEVGYDRELVVTIPVRDPKVSDHIEALKSEWSKDPQVVAITTSMALPTNIDSGTIINKEEDGKQEGRLAVYHSYVDQEFLGVFGIELLAGRNFYPDLKADLQKSIIINETAAKALGWTPMDAVGKQIFNNDSQGTIIGVVKDFHMHSMHMAIEPLMLRPQTKWFRNISVKVLAGDLPRTIAALEAGIAQYSAYPFEYRFLNDEFDQLYQEDLRVGELLGFFTLLSIIIASLGLFGLAAFATGQRTKEVGIRKILGASAQSIVALLSKDFMKMVLIGFLLAIPVAWYGMHRWLQDFAYHIELRWWLFAVAGVAAMLLAFFTVGAQSLKAVLSNPVEALKQ